MRKKTNGDNQEQLDFFAGLTESEKIVFSQKLDRLFEIDKESLSNDQTLLMVFSCKFPKICQNCSKRYDSLQEFFEKTVPLEDHGWNWEDGIEVYCNCECDSTLLLLSEVGRDRRDHSDAGKRRRQHFQECAEELANIANVPIDSIKNEMRLRLRSLNIIILDKIRRNEIEFVRVEDGVALLDAA